MEAPQFTFDADTGRLHFDLHGCDKLLQRAINRACEVHRVPFEYQITDGKTPWERMTKIGERCHREGFSFALNSTTIIGNQITEGAKSAFWQKVMPVAFELVCQARWPQLVPGDGIAYDFSFDGHTIDCKCKHRNVKPYGNYIATVPKSQEGQEVDYYCFGQIANELKEGFITGVMSKWEFALRKKLKVEGDKDNNGEGYVCDVHYVSINEVPLWTPETVDAFIPPQYLVV